MKVSLRVPLISAFLLLFCAAGEVLAARSAGSAALIIGKLPVGTRAIALSGAYTALADDASAVWWNPAGLAKVNRFRLSALHVEQGQGVRVENLMFAQPVLIGGAVAASGCFLNMPPMVETMEDSMGAYAGEGGSFEAYEFKGAAGYGGFLSRWGRADFLGPLWDRGAVGVNVTVLGERIAGQVNYSVSADLGYLYDDATDGRRFGLVVRQAGAPARGSPLPVTGQAGVAQDIGMWVIAADVLTAVDDSYRLRGGIEWTYAADPASVTFRAGAQHSFASYIAARLSMGFGYRLNLPGDTEFMLDYAYVPVESFEDMHAVSMEVAF